MLDAERLRVALKVLNEQEPARAGAVKERARQFAREMASVFPGNPHTGVLVGEDNPAWEDFAGMPEVDTACPVLDPATGRCEFYAARPLTCRVFGPPVRNDEGIGVCELCYVGADQDQLLAGEMQLVHHTLEEELTHELPPGETIIAWALLPEPSCAG